SESPNPAPRSTSGISNFLPDRGGHSISQKLLLSLPGSQSPSNAHAFTIFPLVCLTVPKAMKLPFAVNPVSSVNSLFAASSGSSPSTYSPFGTVHAPASFPVQNGP